MLETMIFQVKGMGYRSNMSPRVVPECNDVPIKIDPKYNILDTFATKVEQAYPDQFYITASSRLNVKNLSDADNLRVRVNNELSKLIVNMKLAFLQNSVINKTNPTFKMLDTNVMEYNQPEKCELLMSPKIFRIFGMVPPHQWITTTKLTGIHKPGLG